MPVVDFHLHCYDRPFRAPESLVVFMDRELAKAYGSFARFLEQYGSAESFYPNDPKLYPVYAKAQELGIPVKCHTGTSVFPASRLKYGDPVYIDDVAVDFPDLVAIITHSGRILGGNAARLLKLT
jgi:predicted TIM-barrel fold metal-dependent hydrolase